MCNSLKILVIGYGNPGRLDDGLGQRCIDLLENTSLNSQNITFLKDYQLNLDMSDDIANHDLTIFVDACRVTIEPFSYKLITSKKNIGFSTHSIAPEALLELTETIYGIATNAYVLAIRGYDFDGFGEHLSTMAQNNLDKAVLFLLSKLS